LVALLAVAFVELTLRSGRASAPDASEMRPLITGEAADYGQALRRLDLEVQTDAADAAARPGEWLFEESLARASMARARLTGDYRDFGIAQAAVDRAFSTAPPGTGPHLTAAILAFSLHRLTDAERMLDQITRYAVPPPAGDLAEVLGMRGDIALYRGDPAAALRHYREAEALVPGSADFRMAVYHSHAGRPEEADAALVRVEAALRRPTHRARAEIALLRGIIQLDNRRLQVAHLRFKEADRLFPGHWLIEEHIAEVLSLTRQERQAELILRDVVRRTQHPEYMDALAGLARRHGDQAEALRWSTLAREGWVQRIRLFPEAAYGHGIDHCLDVADAACALDLATRNHQARPYGEAKLKLARALALNGRSAQAEAMIAAAEAAGWRPSDIGVARRELLASR
jgi:tetratricopeptide (TPR) repeat protein